MPIDRKSTRLNSSHMSISYFHPLSLHDALPICQWVLVRARLLRFIARSTMCWQRSAYAIPAAAATFGNELVLVIPGSVLTSKTSSLPKVAAAAGIAYADRSEEHTSELQSHVNLVLPPSFPTRRSSDLSVGLSAGSFAAFHCQVNHVLAEIGIRNPGGGGDLRQRTGLGHPGQRVDLQDQFVAEGRRRRRDCVCR